MKPSRMWDTNTSENQHNPHRALGVCRHLEVQGRACSCELLKACSTSLHLPNKRNKLLTLGTELYEITISTESEQKRCQHRSTPKIITICPSLVMFGASQ